jgi:single-strand DNA-binding protein
MSITNINHVMLTGHLTNDPELRPLPSGDRVCKLRIAINSRRRNPTTGEMQEKPDYFDVVVFGNQGENAARYLHKGRPVAVAGRLDWRSWKTKVGLQAQAVSVVADTVQFIGSSPTDAPGAGAENAIDT